jgi:hypothetical protein
LLFCSLEGLANFGFFESSRDFEVGLDDGRKNHPPQRALSITKCFTGKGFGRLRVFRDGRQRLIMTGFGVLILGSRWVKLEGRFEAATLGMTLENNHAMDRTHF